MGWKTIEWTFQATNKRNLAQENLDIVNRRKPYERNCISPDTNSKNNAIRTMSKQEQTRRDKIADIDYVVIEMKRLITKANAVS